MILVEQKHLSFVFQTTKLMYFKEFNISKLTISKILKLRKSYTYAY